MSDKDIVDATDGDEEEGGGGFFGRIGKVWTDFAYEKEGGEETVTTTPPKKPTTTPAATAPVAGAAMPAIATPTAPAAPTVDAAIVEQVVGNMHEAIMKKSAVFRGFMGSYLQLRTAIKDVKSCVNGAVALMKEGGPADLRLSLTELRQVLSEILQKARDQRDEAKRGIETKRGAVTQRFEQEGTRLNQRIQELTQQLQEAQDALTGLPARRQEELAKFDPELRQLEVIFASVETANSRVLNELGTIERNLE